MAVARERFARYEREPTRIGITPLRRLKARHTTPVRFSISKVSAVTVRVWSKKGLSLTRTLQLPYGHHTIDWTPPARGRFRLRIDAQGPSGPLGVATRKLRVVLPKPKPKKPCKAKLAPARRCAPKDVLTPRPEREKVDP